MSHIEDVTPGVEKKRGRKATAQNCGDENVLVPLTMKFGKNLQRVIEISDPAWSPYWVNYKVLKKLLKSFSDDPSKRPTDSCTKGKPQPGPECSAGLDPGELRFAGESNPQVTDDKAKLQGNPGEVAFFRILHEEVRKGTRFFGRALEEFAIRKERLQQGMLILKRPESLMMTAKWSVLAKSIFRLYKDLLLLETYAIMTVYAFSKILKKHDKVTGHTTKSAFMSSVVSSANFADYPTLIEMIATCERLYNEVSEKLVREGTQDLHEDERLFISMLSNMHSNVSIQHRPPPSRVATLHNALVSTEVPVSAEAISIPTASHLETWKTDSLRTLVEENDCENLKRRTEGEDSDSSLDDAKPSAQSTKRPKIG